MNGQPEDTRRGMDRYLSDPPATAVRQVQQAHAEKDKLLESDTKQRSANRGMGRYLPKPAPKPTKPGQ